MPVYEYACRKCGEKFSEVMTMKEHEARKVLCPKCQSNDLEKIIEPFFAKRPGRAERGCREGSKD